MIITRLVPFTISHCHWERRLLCKYKQLHQRSLPSVSTPLKCYHLLKKKQLTVPGMCMSRRAVGTYTVLPSCPILQSLMLFASIVNVFLKTLSKRQSPTQRQTRHHARFQYILKQSSSFNLCVKKHFLFHFSHRWRPAPSMQGELSRRRRQSVGCLWFVHMLVPLEMPGIQMEAKQEAKGSMYLYQDSVTSFLCTEWKENYRRVSVLYNCSVLALLSMVIWHSDRISSSGTISAIATNCAQHWELQCLTA